MGRGYLLAMRSQSRATDTQRMSEKQLRIEPGRGPRLGRGDRLHETPRAGGEQLGDRRGSGLDSSRSHRKAKMPACQMPSTRR